MLVLTRRIDESIVIDDHVVITVVEIRGDKVRLAIMAPIETEVHREENARRTSEDAGRSTR
jgi:carbon storage regulator